ncbi:MAG: hypothetical protein ACRC7O_07185, partial [Fimbriiglobus sp.]
MPRADHLDHWHRRAFVQASVAAVVGAAGPDAAAPAPRPRDEPAELPALPNGVVRRFGSPLFRGPAAPATIAFTPDSRRLVGWGFEQDLPSVRVTVWDATTGRRAATLVLR